MAKGVSVHGDLLVTRLNDGTDLNEIWAEVQEVLELWNNERRSITDLLSFRTTKVNDVVPQSWTTDSFEEATEFGIPRAIRPPSDYPKLGYPFRDFDRSADRIHMEVPSRGICRAGSGARDSCTRSRRETDDKFGDASYFHSNHSHERLGKYGLRPVECRHDTAALHGECFRWHAYSLFGYGVDNARLQPDRGAS